MNVKTSSILTSQSSQLGSHTKNLTLLEFHTKPPPQLGFFLTQLKLRHYINNSAESFVRSLWLFSLNHIRFGHHCRIANFRNGPRTIACLPWTQIGPPSQIEIAQLLVPPIKKTTRVPRHTIYIIFLLFIFWSLKDLQHTKIIYQTQPTSGEKRLPQQNKKKRKRGKDHTSNKKKKQYEQISY